MLAILKREFRAYFLTPAGYVFMGFFLLISGFFFTLTNLFPGDPNYNGFLGNITFTFLIVVPILTMRLISEETRQKTDQLLLTSPLKVSEIVIGKYLAAVGVFLFALLVTCLYPYIMQFHGFIAFWEIIGGYIGFFLLGASFIAVGLLISSLTDNQVSAAVATFGILLLIWLLDFIKQGLPSDAVSGFIFLILLVLGLTVIVYQATKNIPVTVLVLLIAGGATTAVFFINKALFEGFIIYFFDWFSLLKRFENFTRGILSLGSFMYFLSFITAMVFLTVQNIVKRRWN